jgi:GT2 family glycosyltransferase
MAQLGPRPWTVFIRRSFSWANRTLSEASFVHATNSIAGTVFCAQNDGNPKSNAKPLVYAKTFREFMACIAVADLVVTPDTGPLHVASGLAKPIIAIEQCNNTEFRVNDQTDYTVVASGLKCAPCHDFVCAIHLGKPPCQNIDSEEIAKAANRRLAVMGKGGVSALIPVCNPSARAARCIEHVKDQVGEVVVSLDAGAIWNHESARIVRGNGKRRGYGKTCNRGARETINDWILMLNDDCFLHRDAVSEMLKAAQSMERVAIVGCLLRYPDGTIQHGGQGRGVGDIGFGHIDHRQKNPTIKQTVECESVTFAAALVNRQAFYEAGGFDERYDCYSEDTDLCMKVRRAGWKVLYCPTATGIHDESQSTTSHAKERMLRESDMIFRDKWEPYFRLNMPGSNGTNWKGTK